jgi:hypothetical protein
MEIQHISKEEHRTLLNGRIDAIKARLKHCPKWRGRLYRKAAEYQSREFHLQNVLRNRSTNEDLTRLLEEVVVEFETEKLYEKKLESNRIKRQKVAFPQ